MVRFGRTVGSQVVDALTQRLEGASGSHVTVAGINVIGASGLEPEAEDDDPFGFPEWAKDAEREADARTITAADILLQSAFHLSSRSVQGGGPAFTVWGRVATGGFETEEDGVTMDGDVTTGLVGFDAEWERALAGVMLSQSEGEGSYRLGPCEGQRRRERGKLAHRRLPVRKPRAERACVGVGARGGVGSGELTLHQEVGKPMPTDFSMRMGAVGVKGQVLDGSGPSGLGLNVKSDAMWVGTKRDDTEELASTRGDVTRLRFIVEGERAFDMGGGSDVHTPSAEVGLCHDGGDAETGTGVEVGAGLQYTAGTLTIEAEARTLVAHEASGYEEWGGERSNPRDAEFFGPGPHPLHRPRVGAHGERHRAALVRARRTRAWRGLRVRGRGPGRDGPGLRLRPPRQPGRAHALHGAHARGCRGPRNAHRHPLAVGPRCGARTRNDPADK